MKFRPSTASWPAHRRRREDRRRHHHSRDSAKEKPSQGEITAVGPGGRDEAGKLIPIDPGTVTVCCSENGPALRSSSMVRNC